MGVRRLAGARGLTAIELIVVLLIAGILAAVAVGFDQGIRKRARLAADRSTVAALRSAGAIYFGRTGRFPSEATARTLVAGVTATLQCPGATWSMDATNGKITYSPNDVTRC